MLSLLIPPTQHTYHHTHDRNNENSGEFGFYNLIFSLNDNSDLDMVLPSLPAPLLLPVDLPDSVPHF